MFFNRFVWLLTSPTRVFADIDEKRAPWWEPWAWQSILYVMAGWLSLPVQGAVARLNPGNLSPEQLEKQLDLLDRFGWVSLVGTPLLLLAIGVALAGLTYVLVSILSERADFRRYFTLTLYASVIGGLSMIVTTAIVRMRGVDAIRTAQDAQITLGLGFLAPEGSTLATAILSTINVFSVWSLVILGMGLMRIFGMSRNSAVACVLPWWIISVIFTLVGGAMNGMG